MLKPLCGDNTAPASQCAHRWHLDGVEVTGLLPFQHYLHELVIRTLVQHNLFYTLHQFLQYHVLSDSKPLVGGSGLHFV